MNPDATHNHRGRHHREDHVAIAAAQAVSEIASHQERLLANANSAAHAALSRQLSMIQGELLHTFDDLNLLDARDYTGCGGTFPRQQGAGAEPDFRRGHIIVDADPLQPPCVADNLTPEGTAKTRWVWRLIGMVTRVLPHSRLRDRTQQATPCDD